MFYRLASVLSAVVFCATAQGVTLDWDTVTWTNNGAPPTNSIHSNSYNVDPLNAGNDITVTVSGNTALMQYGTPAIAQTFSGGLTPIAPATGISSLVLGVDFTNQSQFITVKVDFSALYAQGVQNVSFMIFDVDFDNVNGSNGSRYQDQLRSISAIDVNGAIIAPTITTSANNTEASPGIVNGLVSTPDTGAGAANGNVTISFGTAHIRSFTFTYGSGPNSPTDPTYQHIGLHDINFTPVPEINPAWTAMFSCFAAGVLILRHRANFRK
jgi:hypothetical protein